MKTSRVWVLGVLCGAGFLVASSASATVDKQCLVDARMEKHDCLKTCVETWQASRDMCRNIDHVCAENCRAGRAACLLQPLADLLLCKDPCQTKLLSDKADCRTQFPFGSMERDQCIDAAQVVAFQCRDACREIARPFLKACRDGFHVCIRSCVIPPPAP